MDEKGFVRVHWSKKGLSGSASAEFAPAALCDIEIPIDPVHGVKLWVDVSPAPSLIEFSEIAVFGKDGEVLQHLSTAAQMRSLMTGPGAFWTAHGDARLIALGEQNLLHIDIAEASAPAHKVRLRLGIVETSSASSLAAAIGNLLVEERKGHEAFAREVDALLEYQRSRIAESGQRSRSGGWLASIFRGSKANRVCHD